MTLPLMIFFSLKFPEKKATDDNNTQLAAPGSVHACLDLIPNIHDFNSMISTNDALIFWLKKVHLRTRRWLSLNMQLHKPNRNGQEGQRS